MAVEIFDYDSIPQDALGPGMQFLLTKWNALSEMNKLTLQALAENSSFNVVDNSAYMLTAGDDDFFYMHMGANVRDAVGRDRTGQMLSALPNAITRDLLVAYRQTVEQGKPLFLRFTSPHAQNALVWERLVLPVPVARLGTILLCYSEVMSHHHDVFEYLFRNARHPSIITYPIFDSAQELDDGWVLLMNDAARAAFSYRQPIGNLRLRELPLFQFGQLWAQLRTRYACANPHATVSLDRVELDLIKVKRLLALRFGIGASTSGALA
jgi:hypothetical protein